MMASYLSLLMGNGYQALAKKENPLTERVFFQTRGLQLLLNKLISMIYLC